MTKADIIARIVQENGIEKSIATTVGEAFMESTRESMIGGNKVFLRDLGSFITKQRAEKKARNLSKNTTIVVPAHPIPAFRPVKTFLDAVKEGK